MDNSTVLQPPSALLRRTLVYSCVLAQWLSSRWRFPTSEWSIHLIPLLIRQSEPRSSFQLGSLMWILQGADWRLSPHSNLDGMMPNTNTTVFVDGLMLFAFSYSLCTSKHLAKSVYRKDVSVFVSPLGWKSSSWHICRDGYQVDFPLSPHPWKHTQSSATDHHCRWRASEVVAKLFYYSQRPWWQLPHLDHKD